MAAEDLNWLDVLIYSKAPHLLLEYGADLAPLLYTCREARSSPQLLGAAVNLKNKRGRSINLYAEVTRNAELLSLMTAAGLALPTTERVDRLKRCRADLLQGIRFLDENCFPSTSWAKEWAISDYKELRFFSVDGNILMLILVKRTAVRTQENLCATP